MATISWNVSKEDHALVQKIADRTGVPMPRRMNLIMDLEATHANGCPLRLNDLLDAEDFDFWHDISGINKNLNHETGKLENHFLPRFAKKES